MCDSQFDPVHDWDKILVHFYATDPVKQINPLYCVGGGYYLTMSNFELKNINIWMNAQHYNVVHYLSMVIGF